MIDILYEDELIIVVIKPPGMPSQKDRTMAMDLVTTVQDYLVSQDKKVSSYLGLVHRLDRPVGGAMVLAKTKQANTDLSLQIKNREFKKSYIALCTCETSENKGRFVDYLIKTHNNMAKVVDKNIPNSKEAILEYEVIGKVNIEDKDMSLVSVKLETGRFHQIRAQLAFHNMPIWGDTKYNPDFIYLPGWHTMALFSAKLGFVHPKTKKIMTFSAIPDYFPVDNEVLELLN